MRKYKEVGKRALALLLCFCVIMSGISLPAYAQTAKKSLYLTATTTTKALIEPVRIEYDYVAGKTTLQDVLENSGYNFEIEGSFVECIVDGEPRGYYAYMDNETASFSMKLDPATIQVLGFCVSDLGDNDAEAKDASNKLSALVKSMADFQGSTVKNIKNYPPAKAAYEDGKEALIKASGKDAVTAKTELDAAVQAYIDNQNSTPLAVTVKATKGSQTVTNPKITFTDISGNVTVSESGSVIKVVSGEYDYVIEDGGYNRIEGSLTVDGEETVSIAFPEHDWFADMKPLKKDKSTPYEVNQNKEKHTAEFLIDDTADENSVYLRVDQTANLAYGDDIEMKAYYTQTTGRDWNKRISWDASGNKLTNMVSKGMTGATLELKATYETAAGYTQVQTYDVTVHRIPTLKKLELREESMDGTSIMKGFSPTTTTYTANTVASKLYVVAESFGEDGYTIEGVQNPFNAPSKKGNTVEIPVKVSHTNGYSRIYTLKVAKEDAVPVKVELPAATTVEITNENGNIIQPYDSSDDTTYRLIPGESYTYTATKSKYFHTKASFTAAEGLTVDVKTPDTANALSDFIFHDNYKYNDRLPYECEEGEFKPNVHEYTYIASDLFSSGAVQATVENGYTATAIYDSQSHRNEANQGVHTEKVINQAVDEKYNGVTLTNLLASCGYAQQLCIRLSKAADDVTYYQDYNLTIQRSVHLASLKLADGEESVDLLDVNGEKVYFDDDVQDYFLSLVAGTKTLTLNASFMNELDTTSVCGGYTAEIQGQTYDQLKNIILNLSEDRSQTIEIKVMHQDENSVSTTFKLHVSLQDLVPVKFNTTPTNAMVFIKHKRTNKVVQPMEDGRYSLLPGQPYIYTVSCHGYLTKQDQNYIAPTTAGTVSVTLQKAPVNTTIDNSITSAWPSFRNSADNNCIVDAKLPTTSDDTALYWATKIGDGYGKAATGCPIIVDGYIYTYAGDTIYKVDSINGAILATGKMVGGSNFAINPPTYAEGMIFVGLSDGRVQAFNAKTLESLWVFKDEKGGQPNCSITYKDGYIYTGFWKGENQDANYVCISVTDEDPTKTTEEKKPSWTHTGAGGFYWAGAYITDKYLLIGTDDGKSGYLKGYGHVLSVDPKSGRIIDDLKMPNVGDIRCDMTNYNGKFYFTSKGGYFYEVSVDQNGNILDESLRYVKLDNGGNDPNNPGMSTSTPTIYNGRAYIGVSGTGQFEPYSGHNITVIDLAAWEIAYKVETQGYPQTSGLLTTAYEEETGAVYVYFFDNDTPGKLRVLKDEPGQTRPAETIKESYDVNGKTESYKTAPVIFTPVGDHAQYALCSPIVDEYGTIYFKNDSARLMAMGNKIEKIEITKQPNKMRYVAGETFDPTGMEVIATYSNGMTRNVTNYITYATTALTLQDKDFNIRFQHVMYQNKDGKTGVDCPDLLANLHLDIMNISKVKAKAPTCTTDGNIEYFVNRDTGKKYADAEATRELTDAEVILPKGHTETVLAAKAPTCTKTGLTKGKRCSVCGTVTVAQTKIAAKGHTAGKAKVILKATATKAGKKVSSCTICGTAVKTTAIKAAKVSLSKRAYPYTGEVIKTKKLPKVVVKTAAGKTIPAKYYTVTKPKNVKKMKDIGRYTYTVKFKSTCPEYKGTVKLHLEIKPAKITIKAPKAAKKAITVKWKKGKKAQVTGYQVMVATDKKFTKNVKKTFVKGYSKTSYKMTKLKAKQKYFVKVRAYKTVKEVKIYSDWSKVKTVKTK